MMTSFKEHGSFCFLLLLVWACALDPIPCYAENANETLSIDEVNASLILEHDHHSAGGPFYFGFDLRSGPLEDARQHLPLLRYLERTTGYKFDLRFTPKNSTIIDELGAGQVDFAFIGAVSFIKAREKYGVRSLVQGVNTIGLTEYQSMIIVSPDSPIRSIRDLKGRHFAFGASSSTQGHLIPRIVMAENQISLTDFADYTYTGSHRACANAVIEKIYDACGLQDNMAKRMADDGLVKILHVSNYYPSSGIAAAAKLDPSVTGKVKQALLAFDPTGRDKDVLYNWQNTEMPLGFRESTDAAYGELQRWLTDLKLLE